VGMERFDDALEELKAAFLELPASQRERGLSAVMAAMATASRTRPTHTRTTTEGADTEGAHAGKPLLGIGK